MEIKKLARKCVQNITPYLPGKPIEELKRELKIKKVYKLASNENSLGPSPLAIAAIKRELGNVNRYPDGNSFYLRRALAKKLKLYPENLIIGNGSDELIVLALKAFINPGDEVIIAEPTFLIYKLAAVLAEAKVRSVPLRAFRYDLEAMKEQITSKTKLIFIANPDNPTGSYVSALEIENFLKAVPKNVLVFIDEAYYEYVEARDYPQSLKYLNKGNIIVSRTFSKAYGLSGLRIGWAAAAKEIIYYLNQAREPFNVNRLAQVGAEAALADKRHVLRSRAMVSAGRKYICGELKKQNLIFVPSVANFVLFNAGEKGVQIFSELLHRGIIVREMSGWGLKNFIRVTIGTSGENKLFIKNLKKILQKRKEIHR